MGKLQIRVLSNSVKKAIVVCGLLFTSILLHAQTHDMVTLTFSDWYVSTTENPSKRPMLPRARRTHKSASYITLKNKNLSDEGVLKSLNYAFSAWEANILSCDSIFIEVRLDDIEEDIRTEVQYYETETYYYPLALARYLNPTLKQRGMDRTPDGIITINKNVNWDYNLADNIDSNKKNLPYGIMRSIARILGFGSSVVIDSSGNVRFATKRGHTVFNSLVTNSDGVRLTSVNIKGGRPNEELKSYINAAGKTFLVSANGQQYQLQSPPYTQDTPPFAYLDDRNSLMRSNLQIGNYFLQIDSITKNILEEIGWKMTSIPSLEIVSDDVPDTGRASAYSSHDFYINQTSGVSIQNPEWRLVLPLADGTSQTIVLPDNNHSCTVGPISNESRYKITMDGDIEGALFFSYMSDGVKQETKPFKIYFELRPLIESVVIEKIVDNAPYASYDAHYKIVYRGADKVYVSVEEEYSSILKSSILREPNIAYGVAGHITAPYYAWIDFVAKNDYGKDTYTVELQPYGIVSSSRFPTKKRGATSIPSTSANHDVYEAYRMDGMKLGTFTNLSEINRMNYKGILIVKHKGNGIQTESTIKLIKR